MSKTKQITSKRVVGMSMFVVGMLMPMTQIPQIKTLYTTQVTTGLSIETWVMYLLCGFVPLGYAFVYKLTPLIISNVLWIIVDIIMIAGIIKFGMAADGSTFETLSTINAVGKLLSVLGFISLSSAFILLSLDLLSHRKQYEKVA